MPKNSFFQSDIFARLLGILPMPASMGLMFLAAKVLPGGPIVSGLTGAFLLASAGALWGKVDNDYPVYRDRHASPDDLKNKKISDMKMYAAMSGLLGLLIGGAGGYAEQEQQRIKNLPEIEPQTVLRTETVTLADEHCKGGRKGSLTSVEYKGKEYRLQCPKAP